MIKQFHKYVSRNVAGMIGISVYILADTFFISVSAGADGITVLNLTLPLYGIIFAIGSMIGIGTATNYALKKARGEKDVDGDFTHALIWQMLIAIPFVLLGIFRPELWLQIMGGDAQIVALGRAYVKIVLIGTPLFMMNYTFTAFARNDNAPTTAMAAALLASAFNIIFDYVFMFPLNMGMAGAALATAMSPIVSGAVCCRHFFSAKSTVRIARTRISLVKFFSCCKLGVSAFVGEISSAVTTTVFNVLLLNTAGNIGVAAYGIVANLSLVAMAVFNGISQGMQPLLSENYGKGREKEMKLLLRTGLAVTLVTEAIVIGIAWIFTDDLVAVFNSESNALLAQYAHTALRLYFLGFLFAGINIMLTTYFSSIGEALRASVISLSRGVVAIVVCAIVMNMLFGINGIWLSFLCAELITFGVVWILHLTPGRRINII